MAAPSFSTLTLVATCCAAAGCGGGSDGPADSALLGIYTLDTRTENTSGCDAEGPSILADRGETALYVKQQDVFGFEFLAADFCVDVSDCMAEVADDAINLSGLAFESGNDDDGWIGTGHIISGGGDGPCGGQTFEYEMASTGADSIAIEVRRTNVEDVPRDSEGFCDGDAAELMAASLPCSELEVATATFSQAI